MSNGLLTLNTRTNLVSRDMEMAAWRDLGAAWLLIHNDHELVPVANSAGAKTIYRQDPDTSLPPFQNGSEMQAHAEAFVQTRLEKGAAVTHLTNEIVSSPSLQQWTKFALQYCVRVGGKAIPFNFGTHADRWQFEQSEANVKYCVEHDIPIGVHVYLDGQHDATAYEWLWLKQKYGGTWIITEFNYIVSYTQGELGPLATQSDEQHALWLEANVTKLIEKVGATGLVICYFSFDPWPPDKNKRDKGFGAVNRPKTLAEMASLDQRYIYVKGKPIVPPTPVEPFVPAPTTGGFLATLTKLPASWVNVRAQPYADAADLGDLHKGDQVTQFPIVPEAPGAVYIEKDKLKGWVSLQNGAVVFTPNTIPVPPPSDTITLSKADYDALLHGATNAQEEIDVILSILERIKPPASTDVPF